MVEAVKSVAEEVDNIYVEPDNRVLDPTLLDQSLIDRMPSPTGWRMLILPYRGKGTSEGEYTYQIRF